MKAFGEFFNNQIEYATTVILSRSQNATPEQLSFVSIKFRIESKGCHYYNRLGKIILRTDP